MRLAARFTTAESVTLELVTSRLVAQFATALVYLLLCASVSTILAASPNVESKAVPDNHLRRPAAMVLTDDCLYVANRQSGTISRIDVHSHSVLDEQRIGTQLSDLRQFRDDCLIATDEATNELLLVCENDGRLNVSKRIAVARTPVSLAIDQRSRISVASLWARRVTVLDGTRDFAVVHIIDLPFAPRVQCLLPGERLAVADSFGGKLAVIDLQHGKLLSLRSLNAHNIRGLSISNDGKQLLITNQQLINYVPTTQNRVSWGQVVSNLMHTVDIEHLIPDERDSRELDSLERDPSVATTQTESGDESVAVVPIVKWFLEPLGEHKNAAGDPGQLLLTSLGQRIVCLSGVNEVGIADNDTAAYTRLSVGRRPVALVYNERSSLVYAANMYDDSVSVIDTSTKQVEQTISLGKTRELSWIEMGEQFFYDARLSFDGWYSCHSCHPDGHTISLTNDNLGDETYQTPKLVLSLLGTEDTRPWAWDGHQVWLREQVSASMKTTMRNDKGDAEIYSDAVGALTDFVRTLKAPPALRVSRGQSLHTNKIKQGKALFAAYGCAECHADNVYTSEVIVDVGLHDEAGERQFNPPSLRGVSQRDAWLHDGRATRLRDVFEKVGHPNAMTAEMPVEEVDALVEFLQTL